MSGLRTFVRSYSQSLCRCLYKQHHTNFLICMCIYVCRSCSCDKEHCSLLRRTVLNGLDKTYFPTSCGSQYVNEWTKWSVTDTVMFSCCHCHCTAMYIYRSGEYLGRPSAMENSDRSINREKPRWNDRVCISAVQVFPCGKTHGLQQIQYVFDTLHAHLQLIIIRTFTGHHWNGLSCKTWTVQSNLCAVRLLLQ